jgi:Gryzun, putative trafficking through Golgi
LPIVITLENGENEAVTLQIQHIIPPSAEPQDAAAEIPSGSFSWRNTTELSSDGDVLKIGSVGAGERKDCILIFNAPSVPRECTLTLVLKYTLESDSMTEIQKTVALDIPVIQPFHASFDILPRPAKDGGMPNPFSEGEYHLRVSQSWMLLSTVTRLGSEKLELQQISVTGTFSSEDVWLDIHEVEGYSPTITQTSSMTLKCCDLTPSS